MACDSHTYARACSYFRDLPVAAAMARGEPPPQPSVGWGARTLQRLASWRAGESAEVLAVEEPPPPAAEEAYAPEAELEPEC